MKPVCYAVADEPITAEYSVLSPERLIPYIAEYISHHLGSFNNLAMLTVPLAFFVYNTLTVCRCLAEAGREVGIYINEYEIREGYPHNFTMLEEMGVNRYIFATGYVSSNGSIDFVTGLNASYTRSVGAQIGSSSTLLLALEIIGFVSGNSSITEFQYHAQRVIDDYKVDGFIFVTSYLYRSLQGEEWGRMIEMVKATRSLKRARSQPVIAPFMFRAENFTTSSLWSDLKSYQPWLYADYAYVLLVSGTVDPEVEISTEWAKNVTNWYMEASSRGCRLSIAVYALGRTKGSTLLRAYSDIIAAGGDPRGNGSFEGFYVNTPRQIEYKADLVYSSHLLGMALFFPSADLPPTDPRAMLQTMTSHLRPVAAAEATSSLEWTRSHS